MADIVHTTTCLSTGRMWQLMPEHTSVRCAARITPAGEVVTGSVTWCCPDPACPDATHCEEGLSAVRIRTLIALGCHHMIMEIPLEALEPPLAGQLTEDDVLDFVIDAGRLDELVSAVPPPQGAIR